MTVPPVLFPAAVLQFDRLVKTALRRQLDCVYSLETEASALRVLSKQFSVTIFPPVSAFFPRARMVPGLEGVGEENPFGLQRGEGSGWGSVLRSF